MSEPPCWRGELPPSDSGRPDGRANGTALAQVADGDRAGLARVGMGPFVPGL